MTQTLSMITPPHAPTNQAKVQALSEAYGHGRTVPTVCVLDAPSGLVAVDGSHRLAAMIDAFGEDADVADLEKHLELLDFDAVYEAADDDLREILDRVHDLHGEDHATLCRRLPDLFDGLEHLRSQAEAT